MSMHNDMRNLKAGIAEFERRHKISKPEFVAAARIQADLYDKVMDGQPIADESVHKIKAFLYRDVYVDQSIPDLGVRIMRYRVRYDITITRFCELVGVSYRVYSKIMNGEYVSPFMQQKISLYLDERENL